MSCQGAVSPKGARKLHDAGFCRIEGVLIFCHFHCKGIHNQMAAGIKFIHSSKITDLFFTQ